MRKRWLLLVAVLLGLCGVPGRGAQGDRTVTVRLGARPPWVLSCAGPFNVDGMPAEPGTYRVVATGGGVQLLDSSGAVVAHGMTLRVDSQGLPLRLEGRRYRGDLVFRPDVVANAVGLQAYLYGVVAREIGGEQPEALKAQAVVARTYALGMLRGGELNDSTSHQVYQGVDGETSVAREAVDATEGQVLTWNGRIARDPVYHSTCGGHTEGNENVFLTTAVPYLRGVACRMPEWSAARPKPAGTPVEELIAMTMDETMPDAPGGAAGQTSEPSEPPEPSEPEPACHISKYFRWTVSWPADRAPRIEVLERCESGRVRAARVDGRVVRGDAIRSALRFARGGQERNLYSTCFTVETTSAGVLLKGAGWGHGVGLCQWGARGMAAAGASYEDILKHYYPGTTIGN